MRGSVFIAVLSWNLPAWAQSADAGPRPPAEPAEPEAVAPGRGGAGGTGVAEPEQPAPPAGLKTLSPSQRLPENLQGWMRERQRRNPALVERRPVSGSEPPSVPRLTHEETNVEGLKRRLRSFSEGGVTVLSNRHEAVGPVAPQVTRVAAEAAVARPAPVAAPGVQPADAPEPDESTDEAPVVETRSLRAQPPTPAASAEDTALRWPAWLAVCAGLGLVVVWLRKRRAVS